MPIHYVPVNYASSDRNRGSKYKVHYVAQDRDEYFAMINEIEKREELGPGGIFFVTMIFVVIIGIVVKAIVD